MKVSIFVLLILSLGCSTKIIGIYNNEMVDRSFRTFRVQVSSALMSTENLTLDSLLNNIIATNLKEKGLKISSIPDLYANYLINIHSSSTESSPNYNPYSSYNYMDPFYTNYSTRTYKEGVLIIDIKNDQGKLVWQGSKTFKLKAKQSVHETLPEICREIINAYDLSRSQ